MIKILKEDFDGPHNQKQWKAMWKDFNSHKEFIDLQYSVSVARYDTRMISPDTVGVEYMDFHFEVTEDNDLVLVSISNALMDKERGNFEKYETLIRKNKNISHIDIKSNDNMFHDYTITLTVAEDFINKVLGKSFKEYLKEFAEFVPVKKQVTNYIITSKGGYLTGRTLCVRYRVRTKDYNLSWVNESWVVDNATLRFKSYEDAEKFLSDNPSIANGYYSRASIGQSRYEGELVEVNLDPKQFVSSVPTYVAEIYVKRNVSLKI